MAEAAMDALLRAPVLADLDPAELQLLAGSMQGQTFRAGDIVITEGGSGDGFFVVDSGEAEVTVQGRLQGTINPGDCFGEIALLTGSERMATITATSDLHCYSLAPADFRMIVEGNPAIAWKLYEAMARWLS